MPAFAPDPRQFGLPSARRLEEYEIWDSYFTPTDSGPDSKRLLAEIERTLPTLEKGAIQRACLFLHVGLGTADKVTEERIRKDPQSILAPLKRWPKRLLGMIRLNANDVRGSLDALNRWLRDGPMVGVYFAGGSRGSLSCTHPNYDRLVPRIAELGGLIMQHNWFRTGGKAHPGASTPAELAQLAARHRDVTFISAHAGGEWEKGLRAVRDTPNVLVETSGFDPTSGFIEMAVRELGAKRIVFGSHLPSRSLGTELGKVVTADISERDRRLILGENLRRLLAPIMRNNGGDSP
jgi:predicted TIM-barrel fold metal-dependent hydrolase